VAWHDRPAATQPARVEAFGDEPHLEG